MVEKPKAPENREVNDSVPSKLDRYLVIFAGLIAFISILMSM